VSYEKHQKIRLALQQFWPSGTDAREIVVGTVDHFQGVEFDIVLLLTRRNLMESTLLDNKQAIYQCCSYSCEATHIFVRRLRDHQAISFVEQDHQLS
jgi:hypothetical protein